MKNTFFLGIAGFIVLIAGTVMIMSLNVQSVPSDLETALQVKNVTQGSSGDASLSFRKGDILEVHFLLKNNSKAKNYIIDLLQSVSDSFLLVEDSLMIDGKALPLGSEAQLSLNDQEGHMVSYKIIATKDGNSVPELDTRITEQAKDIVSTVVSNQLPSLVECPKISILTNIDQSVVFHFNDPATVANISIGNTEYPISRTYGNFGEVVIQGSKHLGNNNTSIGITAINGERVETPCTAELRTISNPTTFSITPNTGKFGSKSIMTLQGIEYNQVKQLFLVHTQTKQRTPVVSQFIDNKILLIETSTTLAKGTYTLLYKTDRSEIEENNAITFTNI